MKTIGVPKEIKQGEKRVALVPHNVQQLTSAGFEVLIESGAGDSAGFNDQCYRDSGAVIAATAQSLYSNSSLIVKVKEPIEPEFKLITNKHTIFSYLHLAACPQLVQFLQDSKITSCAFENVVDQHGKLPLLSPMSEIAGKLSVLNACQYLQQFKGLLITGMTGCNSPKVVVVGSGTAGIAAAETAFNLGCQVTVMDINTNALQNAKRINQHIQTVISTPQSIKHELKNADVVIGAVLIPGKCAPVVITNDLKPKLPQKTVFVDISIDQGGCIEDIQPTTHADPVYDHNNNLYSAITNLPGAVPNTASVVLSAAITPYVEQIATSPSEHGMPGIATLHGRLVDK